MTVDRRGAGPVSSSSMLRRLRLVCMLLALGFAGQALFGVTLPPAEAQGPSEPRRGPPPPELKTYRGLDEGEEEGAFLKSGRVVGVLIVIFGAVFVVLVAVYRAQVKELGLPENEKELAQTMTARGGGSTGVSPKELVYGALEKTGGWVTPGRVALAAGVATEEAEIFLGDLLAEGRIKSGRDKQGRRLYRVVE